MSADVQRFAERTITAIAREQFRDAPVERQRLLSTEAMVANLEPWEYRALSTFLHDLVARKPLVGEAFAGHRMVLQALASDLLLAANEESGRAV